MTNQTTNITEKTVGCVSRAVIILGNKWTPLIIKEISNGTIRFCKIEDNLPGISPRTLSQRLDDLEEAQIIDKRAFAEMPPRVEYSLTAKGRDLLPILQQMSQWGEKYLC